MIEFLCGCLSAFILLPSLFLHYITLGIRRSIHYPEFCWFILAVIAIMEEMDLSGSDTILLAEVEKINFKNLSWFYFIFCQTR